MITTTPKYATAHPTPKEAAPLNRTAPRRPQKAQEAPSEAPAPPRTHKSAETMLLGALRGTEADRELHAQIIAAYLEGQGRTLDLLGISRITAGEK